MNRNLPTENLMLQARLQMREALHTDTIAEYADAMRSGADFPPVRVIEAEEGWLVCDGFHRVLAAREASIPSLLCHVTPGTADDALLIALVANCTNGLRRSNADKRRAVMAALERWPDKTDRAIAGLCGVTHHVVANCRPQPEPGALGENPNAPPQAATRTTSDGRQYPVRRAKPAAKPVPEPEPDYGDGAPEESEIADALAADEANRKAMDLLLVADDKFAAAVAEIKRLNAELLVVKGQRDMYMNRANELQRRLTRLQRVA